MLTPHLTYTIAHGNGNDAFSINSSGELVVANLQALNFDLTQRFDLTIDVSDSHTAARTGSAVVVVNLVETNVAPIATASPIIVDGFLPNGTLIGQVDAFDYNVEDTLNFTIQGGNDDGAFTLNGLTGQIFVHDNSGFAQPPVQTRTLSVTVTDDGTPQQTVTVTVPMTITRCIVATMVSVSADSGPCSLRQAILDAPPDALISFHPILSNTTLHLVSPIVITKALTIYGNNSISLSGDSDEDGNGDNGILTIDSDEDVLLHRLTLRDGYADAASGAAIHKLGSGNLTLTDCTLQDNFAGNGGAAIFADGGGSVEINTCSFSDNSADFSGGAIYQCNSALTIRNSTFIGNNSTGSGGAIHQACDAPLAITNSSFYGNVSAEWGGALNIEYSATITNSTLYSNTANGNDNNGIVGGALALVSGGTLVMHNTILAGSPLGSDCAIASGSVLSVNNHNLIEDGSCLMNAINVLIGTAHLATPQDNGGPTLTLALTSNSPARNSGDSNHCATTDQRLYQRTDGQCDIGAYEYAAATTAVSLRPSPPATQPRWATLIIFGTLLGLLCTGAAKQILYRLR